MATETLDKQEENQGQDTAPASILGMSDDEINNLTPEQLAQMEQSAGAAAGAASTERSEGEAQGAQGESGAAPKAGAATEDDDDDKAGATKSVDAGATDDKDDGAAAAQAAAAAGSAGTNADSTAAKDSKEGDAAATEVKAATDKDKATAAEGSKDSKDGEEGKPVEIDYKAAYEKLTAPFKANGRDFQIKSVDDAVTLMQMGANYNKKMSALKPHLKMLKLLENNNLLDETKLSFLIDLDKKDPGAINKLVKESGLDPMDLDAEKAGEYKPQTRTVDDREIELDSVLDDLKESPAYNRTIEIVGTKWDGNSKQTIAAHPQILKVINTHIESGIYDLVEAEVIRERALGRLNGLSDLEAYRQIGDAMDARGEFANLVQKPAGSVNHEANKQAPVIVQPKPKQATEDDKLKEKRRAASSTVPAVSAAAAQYNPLAMSDEEFSKQADPRFT